MTDNEALNFIHNLFMYCKKKSIKLIFTEYSIEYPCDAFDLQGYSSINQLECLIDEGNNIKQLKVIMGFDEFCIVYIPGAHSEIVAQDILESLHFIKDCNTKIYLKFSDKFV